MSILKINPVADILVLDLAINGIDSEWLDKPTGMLEVSPEMSVGYLTSRLTGEIYNDREERFANGTVVNTSGVTMVLYYQGKEFAFTRNSVYQIVSFA